MSYTNDPIADFYRHDRRQQRWLDSRPRCEHCNEPIQDEKLMDIDGVLYHVDCAKEQFEKDTEWYES